MLTGNVATATAISTTTAISSGEVPADLPDVVGPEACQMLNEWVANVYSIIYRELCFIYAFDGCWPAALIYKLSHSRCCCISPLLSRVLLSSMNIKLPVDIFQGLTWSPRVSVRCHPVGACWSTCVTVYIAYYILGINERLGNQSINQPLSLPVTSTIHVYIDITSATADVYYKPLCAVSQLYLKVNPSICVTAC